MTMCADETGGKDRMRKWRILIALLIVLAVGFGVYIVPQMLHPEQRTYTELEDPEDLLESTALSPTNSEINENLEVKMLSADPQIYISGFIGDTKTFRIVFRDPIPAGVACQLFYIPMSGEISPANSVTVWTKEPMGEINFELPDVIECWGFRLDIDTSYAIKAMEVSAGPVQTRKEGILPYVWQEIIRPNWVLHLAGAVGLLAAALLIAGFWDQLTDFVRRLNRNKGYLAFCSFALNLFAGALMFRLILLGGQTNLTAEAAGNLNWISMLVGHWALPLAYLLLVLELLKDWKRALFCAVMLVVRFHLSGLLNTPVVAEMFLIVGFCNLSSRKGIIFTWLLVHILYAVVLASLRLTGGVTDILAGAIKKFLFFPSLERGSSLGTIHPNLPGIWLMSMVMLIWVEWCPKHWWITLISFWGGAMLVWGITTNRTVTAIMLFFPFLSWAMEWIGKGCQRRKILYGTAVSPMLLLGLVWLMWQMSGTLSSKFGDWAFWIRFTEWDLMVQYGVRAFGYIPPVELYLDNLYTWLIISCGVVPTMFTLLAYGGMNIYLVKRQETGMLAIAMAYLFYSIMEHALVYPVFFALPLIAFCRQDPEVVSKLPGEELRYRQQNG